MQDKNARYELKFDLSELYSLEDLRKLYTIIPELSNISLSVHNSNNSNVSQDFKSKLLNNDFPENINISYYQTKINKFPFFTIILSKLKSYFQINESFIIMRTLSIIINEIQSLEKYLIKNNHRSKSNNKIGQKNELKIEKDIKNSLKFEKSTKIHEKNTSSIGTKNNGSNNPFSNLVNKLNNNDCNINLKKRKKVYFRASNNSIKKVNKTEIQPYSYKTSNNKYKYRNIDLNETEKKMSNTKLSIADLTKYEYQNMLYTKEKTSSGEGLKIYIDSNDNINTQNYLGNSYIHNSFNNKCNRQYIKNIKNQSDLFNNNNNLYINIYEQKKNNININDNIPSFLYSKTEIENYEEKGKIKEKLKETLKERGKVSNINNDNNNYLLNKIETEDFNIFELDKTTSKKTLLIIGCYVFNRYGFHNIINYSMFENWCRKIAEGYDRKNPYHTDLHAGDITQTTLLFFKIGKINEICKLNQLSKCALFLSCICHDYKHPGVNNNFLRDTKNILAIKYNDNSILENMHISEAFKLTIDYKDCDIFSGMNSSNYKQIRKEMISCVLYTDMTKHNLTKDFMKTIIDNRNNEKKGKKEDKELDYHQDYLNLLIHSADISNPTKKFDIYWKWAQIVVEEFFQQGDKEKELGLKCSFDRDNLTISQNQLGFIDYIEIPFYSLFVEVFPKLKYLLINLNNNKSKVLLIKEEEKNNKTNNNN